MKRYCYACHTAHDVGVRCPTRQRPSGPRWEALRRAVLERDGFCQECGEPAEHVDHITSLAMGGSNDVSNLRALCAACNLSKGNS